MRKSRKSEEAFTLAEVIVALSVLTLIIGAAISLFQQSVFAWKRNEKRFDVQEELKFALEIISRDVRSAEEVMGISPSELRLKVYDNPAEEEVVYRWDLKRGELVREVGGKTDVIARKITGFEVKYYDGQNIAVEPGKVRRIEVSVRADAGLWADGNSEITLKTSAALRASR